MKRYLKIFLFCWESAFEYRSLSVVWFISALIIPLLMLIFWLGATKAQGGSVSGWNYSDFATYYLFVALANALFISHIESAIATEDIKQGELVRYILKPIPYFSWNLMSEIPWRLIQGFFAIISIILIYYMAHGIVQVTTSPPLFLAAIILAIDAFMLSFCFSMFIAMLAFWFIDIGGILQFNEMIFSVCAGIVIPLVFLPNYLQSIFNLLPFPYVVYYPILAFLGKLNLMQEAQVFLFQFLWMVILILLYKILWAAGRKKFTTVGQ